MDLNHIRLARGVSSLLVGSWVGDAQGVPPLLRLYGFFLWKRPSSSSSIVFFSPHHHCCFSSKASFSTAETHLTPLLCTVTHSGHLSSSTPSLSRSLMYKTKLQEHCQRNSWSLPTYTTTRNGPDHNPKFKATVLVNGVDYEIQGFHKSSKDAQNEAARVAFESLIDAGRSSSDEGDSIHSAPSKQNDDKGDTASSLSGHITLASIDLAEWRIKSPRPQGLSANDLLKNSNAETGTNLVERNDRMASEVQLNYKSYLQELVQGRRWSSPLYSHVREGEPHAPRFKATVTVEGKTFKSPDFFGTVREAEHDAAKIALASFHEEGIQEEKTLSFKNMLKDYSQKRNLQLPTYTTERSGAYHLPTFRSTVGIEGEVYTGDAATTKKEAEANAAKIAWFALKERGSRTSSSAKLLSGTISNAPAVKLASNERNCKTEASASDYIEAGSLKLNNREEPAISDMVDKDEFDLEPEEDSTISSQFAADICSYLNEQFIADNSGAQGTESTSYGSERLLLAPTSSSSKSAFNQSRPKGSIVRDAGTSIASKPQNKVVVFPRLPNVRLRLDRVQVQLSDTKWVAVTGTGSGHGAK